MTALPEEFLCRPFAHRGLHGEAGAEHSPAAIAAAVASGYAVELDIQPSAEGTPMVFHDDDLVRLTDATGPVSARTAAELGSLALKGGGTIPTLEEVLGIIAGRVPLLVEIKDQAGNMGPKVGPLEQAVAAALQGYPGAVAVMSFNPHSVRAFGAAAPTVPRGLVTSGFRQIFWPDLTADVRERLAGIPDFDAVGASFISHDVDMLDMEVVQRLKARGVPILCWTVRSPGQEAEARRIADQITFEGYLPA